MIVCSSRACSARASSALSSLLFSDGLAHHGVGDLQLGLRLGHFFLGDHVRLRSLSRLFMATTASASSFWASAFFRPDAVGRDLRLPDRQLGDFVWR